MIDELPTRTQIDAIAQIISQRCQWFARAEEENNGLYSDVYSPMRKGHNITLAVISGFLPETEIEGFHIVPVEYGIGQRQPELIGERVILHIYRDSNPAETKIVKRRCDEYNKDFIHFPLFAYLKYKEREDGSLKSLQLLLPDANGSIVETKNLLNERIMQR